MYHLCVVSQTLGLVWADEKKNWEKKNTKKPHRGWQLTFRRSKHVDKYLAFGYEQSTAREWVMQWNIYCDGSVVFVVWLSSYYAMHQRRHRDREHQEKTHSACNLARTYFCRSVFFYFFSFFLTKCHLVNIYACKMVFGIEFDWNFNNVELAHFNSKARRILCALIDIWNAFCVCS